MPLGLPAGGGLQGGFRPDYGRQDYRPHAGMQGRPSAPPAPAAPAAPAAPSAPSAPSAPPPVPMQTQVAGHPAAGPQQAAHSPQFIEFNRQHNAAVVVAAAAAAAEQSEEAPLEVRASCELSWQPMAS